MLVALDVNFQRANLHVPQEEIILNIELVLLGLGLNWLLTIVRVGVELVAK